ncbi:MAG: DUF4349 domain-containing protein [Lachnospiraceae bacterium]|nr:DUF4349 domain-containing protein [Lachnospiraceae bacterium]
MKRKGLILITGALITSVIFGGCGSSGGRSKFAATTDSAAGAAYSNAAPQAAYVGEDMEMLTDVAMDAAAAEPVYYEQESGMVSEENMQTSNRKLIKTVELSAETESYEVLIGNLERQVAELGGYIEYQYQYNGSLYSPYDENRSANMTIRIPAERLDEFVVKVGEQTNITNKQERIEDVTLQYVDLESRKKALSTEQDRLLELLEKAETVEDIITIEQRLSEVRYQLENMESQLRTLDNQINYSTVNLYIQEVKRLTPTEEKSIWDKMRNGFIESVYNIGDGFKNGFVGFVINIPYLLIWLIVLVIVLIIFRLILKKIKRRTLAIKQRKAEQEQQAEQEEKGPETETSEKATKEAGEER